jgi:hypothetical protein
MKYEVIHIDLSFYLHLGLPNGLFPSGYPIKSYTGFLTSPPSVELSVTLVSCPPRHDHLVNIFVILPLRPAQMFSSVATSAGTAHTILVQSPATWASANWKLLENSTQRDDLTQLWDKALGPVLLRSSTEVKLIRLVACFKEFILQNWRRNVS